jgi:hypothetical protein
MPSKTQMPRLVGAVADVLGCRAKVAAADCDNRRRSLDVTCVRTSSPERTFELFAASPG